MTSSPNEINETVLNVRVVGGNADGAIDGGTAADLAVLVGGIYNATPPTLTDGEQAAIQFDSSGNLKASLETNIAGERNVSSSTNSYLVVKNEHNGVVLSAGTGAKTISSAPGHLGGIYISAALAGTLTLTGFTAEDGTTAASVVIPVAAAAGFYNFQDARFETSLTAQKSSASDDAHIVIFWRAI